MKRHCPSKQGLTLIEVLLALVILSVGVSTLMLAMARCLSVIQTARHREVARSLMIRVDIENPIKEVEMEEMTDSGDFQDTDGYSWLRTIEMVDEEQRPGLFLVTTRVQWSERGKTAFEEVSEYKYAPEAESVTSQL